MSARSRGEERAEVEAVEVFNFRFPTILLRDGWNEIVVHRDRKKRRENLICIVAIEAGVPA